MNLQGKKILFIGIGFYDYEHFIKQEIERQGANVTFFVQSDTSRLGVFKEKFFRLFKFSITKIDSYYQSKLIKVLDGVEFDYIFVIKGDRLQADFLSILRELHPKADFILYLWDSINRVDNALENMKYFDRVLSFDRLDAQNYNSIKFRPLFHREQSVSSFVEIKYDLSFVGWLHDDRWKKVCSLYSNCTPDLRCFGFLYTGIFTWLKRIFMRQAKYISPKSLSYQKVREIALSSAAIVDLPHHLQTGLSIRAIESIGLGRKLITTSKDIVNYDFYKPENILLLPDNFDINIFSRFINAPFRHLNEQQYNKYAIGSWVKDIFELNDEF